MGRRKIAISRIECARTRQATFTKRKRGLLKKAMELAILCDCEVALSVVARDGQNMSFMTTDARTLGLLLRQGNGGEFHAHTKEDYEKLFPPISNQQVQSEA